MNIGFINSKGGAGKTTMATNFAAALSGTGASVMVIDIDAKQESSRKLYDVREGLNVVPAIAHRVVTGRVGQAILKELPNYDFVIIDSRGTYTEDMEDVIAICDLVLTPLKPSTLDAWALEEMSELVAKVRKERKRHIEAKAFFNMVTSLTDVEITLDFIAKQRLDEIYTVIRDKVIKNRVVYMRSIAYGQAAIELSGSDANAEANEEMQELIKEVFNVQ